MCVHVGVGDGCMCVHVYISCTYPPSCSKLTLPNMEVHVILGITDRLPLPGAYIYVCIYTYVYMCFLYAWVHVYTYIYLCTYACTYTYVCMCACLCTKLNVRACIEFSF